MLSVLREILSIFTRARGAANYYEELKPQSEADLAEKGLTRSDLPRAAFRKLTGAFTNATRQSALTPGLVASVQKASAPQSCRPQGRNSKGVQLVVGCDPHPFQAGAITGP
jgi:hypothetical protein